MLNFTRSRQQRPNRPNSLGGMDFVDPVKKSGLIRKIVFATGLIALCIIIIKSSPTFSSPNPFSLHVTGITHVLVTGGAGYIGSHASLRLLKDSYRVTVVDNLSRGNIGAIKVLQNMFPERGRLQFINADLGDPKAVS